MGAPRAARTFTGMWPDLPLESWQDTYETLHRYVQIPGKIKLALTPLVNHFWNVTLALTARGLTTGPMPFHRRRFQIDFDFVDHHVVLRTSDGAQRSLALFPRSVADFYDELGAMMASLGIEVPIWDHPVEIPADAIPFHEDTTHRLYDPAAAARCFELLARTGVVLEEFRGRFLGKCSPVAFYWGTFDLSVSRFSGRRAPPIPGADAVTREAYSHELNSVGWWPGDARFPQPAFFGYHFPLPDGFEDAKVKPADSFWHPGLKNFLLPLAALRRSSSPRDVLLQFFQSVYEAGADLAGWDRDALERHPEEQPHPEEPVAMQPPAPPT
jgi:hypothetical protein